ncbi:GCD complex subunit gcd7 [Xanthoria parietina]
MPPPAGTLTPGLASFLSSLKSSPIETSVESLVSLLRRRQIRGSRSCAIATAHLLRMVLRNIPVRDVTKLIDRVQQIGQRLAEAQPKELAIGNILRRILGLIRDEAEEDRDREAGGYGETGIGSRNATSITSPDRQPGPTEKRSLLAPNTSTTAPAITSLFSPVPLKSASPTSTPGTHTPGGGSPIAAPLSSTPNTAQDLRAEVVEGVQEIIDELNQADDQIAGYAIDHIHSSEVVLTYRPSMTVQRFILKAAAKRKFTVIHAGPFPNDHWPRRLAGNPNTSLDDDEGNPERFQKSLTVAGVTVVMIPFSAVFALMSRTSKVILDPHIVLADGSLVAPAGARAMAQAASMHQTPVIVLSGVYKLSPVYPSDVKTLIETGNPSSVVGYDQGSLLEKIDIKNPLFDHVPADIVDLYITNLGGHAPSYLYRIIADHYRNEDIHLMRSDLE